MFILAFGVLPVDASDALKDGFCNFTYKASVESDLKTMRKMFKDARQDLKDLLDLIVRIIYFFILFFHYYFEDSGTYIFIQISSNLATN